MRIRDAAMALAPTAFLAAPALAQSNLSGSKANNQATNPAYSQQGTNQANGELSHQDVKQIQSRLQQEGVYHGNIDGIWGPKTRSAVGNFQQQHGLRDTGQANSQTLADLGVNQQLGGTQPAMQGPGTGSTSAGPNAMSATNSSSGTAYNTGSNTGSTSSPASQGSSSASDNTHNNMNSTGMNQPSSNGSTTNAQQ
jgi:peptidoglycan hydrolase-like protein with peptidoglycan-binding domain